MGVADLIDIIHVWCISLLKNKEHSDIMLTVIFPLCVQARNVYLCLTDDQAPLYVLKRKGEGVWSLNWRGPLETFEFWAKLLIFGTNCFIIRFNL